MAIRDEAEAREHFRDRYSRSEVAAAIAVERAALGSDYGANGYTTMSQADELASMLAVSTGERLLDIGSGCGWPGLYISGRTGCDAVISDLTIAGMQRALARAESDGTASRISAIVASARNLPFRPEAFDAIVHTDVLC